MKPEHFKLAHALAGIEPKATETAPSSWSERWGEWRRICMITAMLIAEGNYNTREEFLTACGL